MTKIQLDNCAGICCEKYCTKRYLYFYEEEVRGLKILIPLCLKHAKMYNKLKGGNK